jgi:hypothetical protein
LFLTPNPEASEAGNAAVDLVDAFRDGGLDAASAHKVASGVRSYSRLPMIRTTFALAVSSPCGRVADPVANGTATA